MPFRVFFCSHSPTPARSSSSAVGFPLLSLPLRVHLNFSDSITLNISDHKFTMHEPMLTPKYYLRHRPFKLVAIHKSASGSLQITVFLSKETQSTSEPPSISISERSSG